MKNVPKIRFKGFTDAWEQRNIGELVTESHEKGNKGHRAQKLTVKLWGKGVIPKYDLGSNSTQYYIRHQNQFIYSKLDFLNGAFAVIPSELEGFESTLDLPAFDCHSINPFFLYHYVARPNFYIKHGMIADGSRKAKRVQPKSFFKMPVCVPNLDVQLKICTLFNCLDNLITLHQRKCEQLKTLKKFLLQKMFPENGNEKPELRFTGFTDAWELRKLGDVADIVGGGTPNTNNKLYWNGNINWYSPTEISDQTYLESSQRKISDIGYKNCSAKILPKGTVLFTSRAGIGKTAILLKEGCTNQGFQSIVPHKNSLDSYFIFSRSLELKKYAETVGAGSTFIEVSRKQMHEMKLMLPTFFEEQKNIGIFFKNIDNLITLHQRKCEELKKVKQYLLQNMFPQE